EVEAAAHHQGTAAAVVPVEWCGSRYGCRKGGPMTGQILSALITIVIGVGGAVFYFWGANRLLDLIFPSRGVTGMAAIDNLRRQAMVRPWLFIGPALAILTIYLIYPVLQTLILSFHGRNGVNFVGLDNYLWAI